MILKTQQPPCLAAALAYRQRGWSALALCPHDHAGVYAAHAEHCHRPGKSPLWKWEPYQERLPRVTELQLFWNRNPHCNVGMALGPVSGLIGLDIDGQAGEQLLAQLSKGQLTPTLEFTTPAGGRRLLYQHPPGPLAIKSLKSNGKEAIRILAKGSQTVMPPSIHPTGVCYAWIPGHGPGEIQPAPCPPWLLDLASAPVGEDQGGGGHYPALPTPPAASDAVHRASAYLAKMEPCNPLPEHPMDASTHLLKAATALVVGFGLAIGDALPLLQAWDQGNPQPWPEKELRRKCDQALKHCSKPLGYLMHAPLNGHQPLNGHKPHPLPQMPAPPAAASIPLSSIQKKEVEWLWPGWLPLGKMSVLDGDPDLGKSTLLLDIAARVSTHGMMPDHKQGLAGNVLILSAEDGIDDTILPRLLAAEANLDRIHCVTEIHQEPPVIPKHLKELEAEIAARNARLLIIDPLMAYLAADTRSDQEVRRALHPLAKLAQRQRCAVVYLRHLNKSKESKAIYRGGGSIAIIGAARSGLLVALDPDDAKYRILAHTKHNLAEQQQSLRYRLELTEHQVCRVVWEGSTSLNADDLLQAPPTAEEKQAKEDAKGKVQLAVEILQAMLDAHDNRIIIKHARTECFAAGIAQRSMNRAATQLGLKVIQQVEQDGKRTYLWTPQP